MIKTLDDQHTNSFTADQYKRFNKQIRGSFSGIGAEISKEDGHIIIVSPLEDSPAYKAGIMAGDIILEINGELADDITTLEAVEQITGPEGTEVQLLVRHPNNVEELISIIRQKIKINTIKGFKRDQNGHWNFIIDPQLKIGYIRMTQFSQTSYNLFKQALDNLVSSQMKGLIIDLRYNPGGLLDAAVKISDLFLDEGVIVSTKGRNRKEEIYHAHKNGFTNDFPIVIIVNEHSASASEILSGALKDNNRAIILGTRTYGKGSVQQKFDLGEYGGAKVTTALYYMPNGKNINKNKNAETWGVDPTDGYYIPMTVDQQIEMNKARRKDDVLRQNGEIIPQNENQIPHDFNVTITPQWIDENLADPQLAAALTTITAKITQGQFIPVGKSNATLLAHITKRGNLKRAQSLILEELDEIDKELQRLTQIIQSEGGDELPDEQNITANTDTDSTNNITQTTQPQPDNQYDKTQSDKPTADTDNQPQQTQPATPEILK